MKAVIYNLQLTNTVSHTHTHTPSLSIKKVFFFFAFRLQVNWFLNFKDKLFNILGNFFAPLSKHLEVPLYDDKIQNKF